MEVNVLVVFSSTRGETERLAVTVGVGAIQARASIRLRRLAPEPGSDTGATTPAELRTLERLTRDYVAPRPADPLWADVLILAPSPGSVRALEEYVDQLPAAGPIAGRVAGVVSSCDPQAISPLYAAAGRASLIVVPAQAPIESDDDRQAFGRRVVALARALKTAPSP